MSEQSISVSEMRYKFAEVLRAVEGGEGRFVVTRHGQETAYVISVREVRALEESLAVLENQSLLKSIQVGLQDLNAGRVRDATDVFAEIDAELGNEE